MPSKMKVVLGRGQGSMPIDTKPLPEPRVARGGVNEFKPLPAIGRIQGEPEPGMGQVFGGGPSGRAEEMRGMPVSAPGGFDGAAGNPYWSQADVPRGTHESDSGFTNHMLRPGTGPSDDFLAALINSRGGGAGQVVDRDMPSMPTDGMALDARESMLGLDNPRRITRPPSRPYPRSGGKPVQKPVRKIKKKRLMPRKPRPTNKFEGE